MKTHILTGAAALALATGISFAGISTATFNFENQPTTPNNGGLSSLSLTESGLTLTVDRVGQPFDIVNLSSYNGTSAFGSRSLAPTPPGGNFFNVNFSTPVTSFSADIGDFGVGFSDSLAMTAFSGPNGTGTNLGTASATLPLTSNTTFAYKTLAVTGSSIGSVEFLGGTTTQPDSVFADNFRVKFTPSGSGTGGTGGSGGGTGASVPLPMAAYTMPFAGLLAWIAARKYRHGV